MIQFQPDTPYLRKKFNQLAREELKQKLLADIAMDIQICRMEGWDYREYLLDLRETIEYFIKK